MPLDVSTSVPPFPTAPAREGCQVKGDPALNRGVGSHSALTAARAWF